jgi:putative addiction module component (TIGR02574 family)
MRFGTLEKQALALPMRERAKLAQRLLESLDNVSEAEAEQLWLDVAVRRAEEIDRGAVQLVSAEELESRVQALLK